VWFGKKDNTKDIELCKDFLIYALLRSQQSIAHIWDIDKQKEPLYKLYIHILDFSRYYVESVLTNRIIRTQLNRCRIGAPEDAAVFHALVHVIGECLWITARFGLVEQPKVRDYLNIDAVSFCKGFCVAMGQGENWLSDNINIAETFYNEWDSHRNTTVPSPNGVGTRWATIIVPQELQHGKENDTGRLRLGSEIAKTLYLFLMLISNKTFTTKHWDDTDAEIWLVPVLLRSYGQFLDKIPAIVLGQ